MNATSIGWCTHTVNPVVGCRNGCSYCYARRIAPRVAAMRAAATGEPVCEQCRTYTPHLHPERLPQLREGKVALLHAAATWRGAGRDEQLAACSAFAADLAQNHPAPRRQPLPVLIEEGVSDGAGTERAVPV